ncbi:hypothetical protein GGI06_001959 [Coemansia sp. S85]|nr:hypothetical protein GGI06_001959 [Coemansia sp. S85]
MLRRLDRCALATALGPWGRDFVLAMLCESTVVGSNGGTELRSLPGDSRDKWPEHDDCNTMDCLRDSDRWGDCAHGDAGDAASEQARNCVEYCVGVRPPTAPAGDRCAARYGDTLRSRADSKASGGGAPARC